MPVRRIPRKSGSVSGLLPTDKQPAHVRRLPDGEPALRMGAYESTLERDLFICLEFDFAVSTWEEQPIRVTYHASRRQRTYTPDVLVTFRDARPALLVEVKPFGKLLRDPIKCREWARAGRVEAGRRGWQFRVLTEREIRTPFLRTATFLLAYRQQARDDVTERAIMREFGDVAEPTPRRLAARIGGESLDGTAAVLPSVWALVADGTLRARWDARVPADSRLLLPDDADPGQSASPWLRRAHSSDRDASQ